MVVTPAIRNLIREGRLTMIADAIRDYGGAGNVTLDEALFKYYWDGIITMETVIRYCHDRDEISRLNSHMLTRKKGTDEKIKRVG